MVYICTTVVELNSDTFALSAHILYKAECKSLHRSTEAERTHH